MERSGNLTFEAGGTIGAKCLVKLNSGKVVAAAAYNDNIIGINQYRVTSGQIAAIRPLNTAGTAEVCVKAAIDVNDIVFYKEDNEGKANKTATGNRQQIGIALEAATADGDIIEVLLMPAVTTAT